MPALPPPLALATLGLPLVVLLGCAIWPAPMLTLWAFPVAHLPALVLDAEITGRLVYDGLRTWMGYRVAYDPSLPWLLAAALLATLALALHATLRLREPGPALARAVPSLPADRAVALSWMPDGTGAARDFSGIAPDLPELDAAKCVGCSRWMMFNNRL